MLEGVGYLTNQFHQLENSLMNSSFQNQGVLNVGVNIFKRLLIQIFYAATLKVFFLLIAEQENDSDSASDNMQSH